MNAINPVPKAAAAEPSMEEILASIRRIIADDQSLPGHVGSPMSSDHQAQIEPPSVSEPVRGAPEASHPAAVAPSPELPSPAQLAPPRVVSPGEQAGMMDTRHPLAPQVPEVAGSADADAPVPPEVVRDSAATRELEPQEPDLHEAALRDMHDGSDLHLHDFAQEPPMTAHDVSGEGAHGLFSAATSQSLAAAFNTLAVSRLAADSLELRGLAQEMLRPMLKDWLDENLPSMVEGIIRDEIDRMSRGER